MRTGPASVGKSGLLMMRQACQHDVFVAYTRPCMASVLPCTPVLAFFPDASCTTLQYLPWAGASAAGAADDDDDDLLIVEEPEPRAGAKRKRLAEDGADADDERGREAARRRKGKGPAEGNAILLD